MRPILGTAVLIVLSAAIAAHVVGCADKGLAHRGGPVRAAGEFHAQFRSACVAADHPQASEAGAEILAQGGNAVDAAVAAAFALSVVRPESCGIGGGGFMVIHLANHPRCEGSRPIDTAIDFRERAPAAATPEMFETSAVFKASEESGLAVAIPGTVAGLLHALEKYGTLDRAAVLAPAIRLAREGWTADETTVKGIKDGRLSKETPPADAVVPEMAPGKALRERLYEHVGAGDHIRNEGHARVLELIAAQGRDGFYKGAVADAMIRAAALGLGILTHDDLVGFQPKEVLPLRGSFMGRTIVAMPLPSSGGVTMLQTLGLLEGLVEAGRHRGEDDVTRLHLLAECFKHAFADRALYLGDPEFGPDPTAPLLDEARLDAKRMDIDPHTTRGARAYVSPLRGRQSSSYVPGRLEPAGSEGLGVPLPPGRGRAMRPDRPASPQTARPGQPLFSTAPVALAHSRLFGFQPSTRDQRLLRGPEAAGFRPDQQHPAPAGDLLPDDHGTSHLSAVDRWGNAVACTLTINLEYGSKVGVPEFGFFLNNEMDDFLTRRGQVNAFGLTQSERNLPEPGKRPLSSMSPTIVLDTDGRVEMVVGGSGGPRIITGTTQVLLNALSVGMSAGDAVAAARIHHQWMPDALRIEFGSAAPPGDARAISDRVIVGLIEKGHHIERLKSSSAVQAIVRRAGHWEAACDPRKGGRPAGR